ncbi:hypothetical protein MBANPS3_001221 [Mucor bainieri]
MHFRTVSICAATIVVLHSTLISAVPMQSDVSVQSAAPYLSVEPTSSSSLSYLPQEPSRLALPHNIKSSNVTQSHHATDANGLSQFIIDWFDALLGAPEEAELASKSQTFLKSTFEKRNSNYEEDDDEEDQDDEEGEDDESADDEDEDEKDGSWGSKKKHRKHKHPPIWKPQVNNTDCPDRPTVHDRVPTYGPDYWDPDYIYTFADKYRGMVDFFVLSQDKLAVMPLDYVPSFRQKAISNFDNLDDDQLAIVDQTITAFLNVYLESQVVLQSVYEQIIDQFETYMKTYSPSIQRASLTTLSQMRKQVIQNGTIGFDHIQFRGFAAAVDTEIRNTRLLETREADHALILYMRYIENNSDRLTGLQLDRLQFIANSLKMTIPKSVTPEQRTELKAIIDDLLKPYFESATPSIAWDSQEPQETNKFRSRIFSRDPELEEMSSQMLVDTYGVAVKQQNAIRRARTIPELLAVRRQIITQASKQHDDMETRSIMSNMANSYIASVNPRLEAKYTVAFTASDYFYDHGQEFASLSEQDQDKLVESILNSLPIDVVASDRKQVENYIQSEALKSKQRYRN